MVGLFLKLKHPTFKPDECGDLSLTNVSRLGHCGCSCHFLASSCYFSWSCTAHLFLTHWIIIIRIKDKHLDIYYKVKLILNPDKYFLVTFKSRINKKKSIIEQ